MHSYRAMCVLFSFISQNTTSRTPSYTSTRCTLCFDIMSCSQGAPFALVICRLCTHTHMCDRYKERTQTRAQMCILCVYCFRFSQHTTPRTPATPATRDQQEVYLILLWYHASYSQATLCIRNMYTHTHIRRLLQVVHHLCLS